MRSLFAKFLLWFWLGLALLLGAEIALETSSLEQGLALHPARTSGPLGTYYSDLARKILEQRGTAGIDSLLRHFESCGDLEAFCVDGAGVELNGRPIPVAATRAALAAEREGRSMLVETSSGLFVGYPLGVHEGRHLALVLHPLAGAQRTPASESSEHRAAWHWPASVPWDLAVRALVMLLLGGLACFLLARYITAPVIRLRQATHRLADGDLSARVGSEQGGRRDEIVDLGRDFDRMAERLEALVGAQRRLLTDISHELRSPLARMNVALGLLRQRGGHDPDAMMSRLETETERLNRLIGDVLALSRAEAGEPLASPQLVDLGNLIDEIAGDARFEAGARLRDVRVERTAPVFVLGVAGLLRSAIENVVRNAVRHTREGTEVEIRVGSRASGAESQAVVEVRDHGPGLPEDQLERIFEPFYRVEESSAPHPGGAGLGLAIAKRVVLRHRGTIRAARAPEGGLVVTIALPAAVPPVETPAPGR